MTVDDVDRVCAACTEIIAANAAAMAAS